MAGSSQCDDWKGHSFGAQLPYSGDISDLSQQVWILQGDVLVAVPRRADMTPVTITFLPCKYPESLEQDKGTPIYMGIKEPEKCLSCEDMEGQPTLKLKEEKIVDLYNQEGPVKPFLFYHSKIGRTSTFESVAFPGWFIASSSDQSQPIFLTSEQGKTHNTAFDLSLQS
ncbi:PREDICTED: interleukin-36 gamma-like [Condylura cristata]|uniref:interleukin-36 gamma-like n=1 Tax=Condylura cristata TaxID=143302 RepID=UPI00033433D5|nr:PREDICTED: interleukin-36 gamma-like [Condylura cristata]